MKTRARQKIVTIMGAFMIVLGTLLLPVQQATALNLDELLREVRGDNRNQNKERDRSTRESNNPRQDERSSRQGSQRNSREVTQTPSVESIQTTPASQEPVAQPTPSVAARPAPTIPVATPIPETPAVAPVAVDTSAEKTVTTSAQAKLLPKPTVEYESSQLDSSSTSSLYAGALIASGAGMFVYGLSMVPMTVAFANRRAG